MSVILKITLTSFLFSLLLLFIVDFKESKQGEIEPIRMSVSSQIPELFEDHVKIANLEILNEKLKKISEDGRENLQVLSDFDSTLTQFFVDGKPLFNSFDTLNVIPGTSEDYTQKSKELYRKFQTASQDLSLTTEEMSNAFDQIFMDYEKILPLLSIRDSSIIEREAGKNRFLLRKGMKETFTRLKNGSIPITVVSVGIGQIIDFVFKSEGITYDNFYVIANYLLFRDGNATGFRDKAIHTLNKNLRLESSSFFKKLSKRESIILLGDTLADSNMADSAPDPGKVLKIAFLNPNMEGDLENFLKTFDIVIVGDKSMDAINAILRHIL